MKKSIVLFGALIFLFQMGSAQNSKKTNLSLQVSAAAAANRATLANYVWTRTVTVFNGGELFLTKVSSMSVGADGKLVATAVSTTPAKEPKKGLLGDKDRKKLKEVQAYADDALTTARGYIYMSKGKMVDYFDKATITPVDNTIQLTGTNVNKTGDSLNMIIDKKTLAYISESFQSKLTNNDPVSVMVSYKTFSNGLTAVDNGEMNLPAKNIKLTVVNSDYAKKLK
jgi:hypothetical protein